jgi:hypothetical protein
MGIEYFGAPEEFVALLTGVEWVFLIIFTSECIMKLIAYKVAHYFAFTQNVFDFIIVVASLLGLAEDLIPVNVTILRVIRTIRILRAVKFLTELYNILKCLYDSIKHLLAVCMLSSLMAFVFCL